MDQIVQVVDPAKLFIKDSIRLVKRCTKPDRKGEASVLHAIEHNQTIRGNQGLANPFDKYITSVVVAQARYH